MRVQIGLLTPGLSFCPLRYIGWGDASPPVADESVELLRRWVNGEEEALSPWPGGASAPPLEAAEGRGLLLAQGEFERTTAEILTLLEHLRVRGNQ